MVKIQLLPNLFFTIIVVILVLLFIIYFLFFHKQLSNLSSFMIFGKIIAVSVVVMFLAVIFMLEIVVIYITAGVATGTESWLFAILNSFFLSTSLIIIGIASGKFKSWQQYVVFVALIYLVLNGFGLAGLLIEFKKPISDYLNYILIQTNSCIAIYFVIFNLHIVLAVFAIATIFQNEIR